MGNARYERERERGGRGGKEVRAAILARKTLVFATNCTESRQHRQWHCLLVYLWHE